MLKAVLIQHGQIPANDPMPVTIQTTTKRFGFEDQFVVYPLCPSCLQLHDPDSLTDHTCDSCYVRLFSKQTPGLADLSAWSNLLSTSMKEKPEPQLTIPIALLSPLLPDFLKYEGVKDAVEAWRKEDRDDEVLTSIWTARPGSLSKGEMSILSSILPHLTASFG